MSSQQTWLTQEAADRLAAELASLEGEGRKEITAKIEAARAEGDLKENGGYHAARDEQGKMEARIRQLKQMLENAHIGTPPASADGKVGAGMAVRGQPGGPLADCHGVRLDDTNFERYPGNPAVRQRIRRAAVYTDSPFPSHEQGDQRHT